MRVTGGPFNFGDGSGVGFDLPVVVQVSAVGGFVGSTCSEVQKVMLPDTQSINGLWQVSQLCPRTTEQEGSREVT